MIKIKIESNGELITDEFKTKKTTLAENAIVLRRLEEMKRKLLDIEYESEFEIEENDWRNNNYCNSRGMELTNEIK